MGADRLPRAGEPAHHRSDGDVEDLGRLAIGAAVNDDERDQRPLVRVEPLHRPRRRRQLGTLLDRDAAVLARMAGDRIEVHRDTARAARAGRVDIEVLRDPIHPAVEPGPFAPQLAPRQRPLDRRLHQILAGVDAAADGDAEAPQPRQEADDLGADPFIRSSTC